MAKQDEPASGEGAEPAPARKEAPPERKEGAPHMALRVLLGLAGLALLVGFFLPWLRIPPLIDTSGLDLLLDDGDAIGATQRWLLLIAPVAGLIMTAVGFLGLRWSGRVAVGLGVTVILCGAVVLIVLFFRHTAVGLWLIFGGSFTAVISGLFAWLRPLRRRGGAPAADPPSD